MQILEVRGIDYVGTLHTTSLHSNSEHKEYRSHLLSLQSYELLAKESGVRSQ
ncbi:hypothetical protein [Dapis sp. BLCC M172]|uniref:hypothetical protein n=1 Tax=Dapis sp. BLCC M172 TaxID=2975281 RepID=UPI003CEE68C2